MNTQTNFICPICGNKDSKYVGYINNKPYCRKCITFSGRKADDFKLSNNNISLKLDYKLSKIQEKVARQVLNSFIQKENVLIYAVTGAGKTELVYYTIDYALKHNKSVGFAIPRKDVVIDLYPRFKQSFPNANVITVYGDHSSIINGDIILLTTHQLYRYKNFFDLLIVDEIDAFPYKGNQVLQSFMLDSVKGNYILMSATPSKNDIKEFSKKGKVYTIFERYHHHPLIVPEIKIASISPIILLLITINKILKENKPLFIFSPTIKIQDEIYPYIKILFKNGRLVNSQSPDREKIIQDFKNGKYKYLLTTSILERGVTCKNLQVIIYNAEHVLYTKETLIQIAGRVGRKKDAPDGKVYYICKKISKDMKESIQEIERLNYEAKHM